MFKNKQAWRAAGLLLVIAALFVCARLSGVYTLLTPLNIRNYILGFGALAPAVFILIYFLRTFFLFSASVLSIAAGLAFGPFWGTVYTVTGATISSSTAFILTKLYGRAVMDRICGSCGEAVKGLDKQIGDKGFWLILFLRLIPVFPYDGINFAAGLSKIGFLPYFFATLIGIIPGAFAYNYLGGSLINIRDPRILIAVLLVLILISAPAVYKVLKGTRADGR